MFILTPETQTAVVRSCLPFIRFGKNHLARHRERGKKTRQTEEEAGRQHQGMDRPGLEYSKKKKKKITFGLKEYRNEELKTKLTVINHCRRI